MKRLISIVTLALVVTLICFRAANSQNIVAVWGGICEPERYVIEWPLDSKLRTRSVPRQYLQAASVAVLEVEDTDNGVTDYVVYNTFSEEPIEIISSIFDEYSSALNIILGNGDLISINKRDWEEIRGQNKTMFTMSLHTVNTYGSTPKVEITSVKGYCVPWF